MSGPARRIDFDAGRLDDVAITNVSTFRMERMDDGVWWIAVYYEDGGRDVFWLSSKGAIEGRHDDEREFTSESRRSAPPAGDRGETA